VLAASPPTTQRSTDMLRFATAGSVDDGKSTLIGRLLYDSKQIFQDQLDALAQASMRRSGTDLDLSLLTDGLRSEREQGITIDVAYRYFATPRRKFIIADTPGHPRYTRNMVTGASTADLAVILVDARKGVVQQSRRHAFISSLLRIPHLVVCINKMDLVDWDEGIFDAIVQEFTAFAAKLEVTDVTFIPISALHGDNVVARSLNAPWYDGPPLLYHLEHVHIASDRNLIDVRFPVQWVIRPSSDEFHDYRAYAGQVAGGVLRVGDEIVVLPRGEHSRIARIDTYDGPLDEAFVPMSVSIALEDDLDVSRGDMVCRAHNQPTVARELDAVVCWMSERPASAGRRYVIKATTRTASAIVGEVIHRIDVDTLHRDESATELGLNDIGRLALRTSVPLVFDEYRRNRATGSFILIDEATNDTVGAGMVLGAGPPDVVERTGRAAPDVRWEAGPLDREERFRALGTRGATVWLTGLPASGKSTIAGDLEERLVRAGRSAYRLDGDNLRHGLNADLGFEVADRQESVRRAANAARLMADAGTIAVVSLVSPYEADRARARELHGEAGLDFFEVFVDTPLEICEQRDPKGLYAKARRGEMSRMTGIDDPYEAPAAPDLVVRPGDEEDPIDRLWALLVERGILPREAPS
jgi:bifunctional enzyme CysN/CysC